MQPTFNNYFILIIYLLEVETDRLGEKNTLVLYRPQVQSLPHSNATNKKKTKSEVKATN